jgi:proline racemase
MRPADLPRLLAECVTSPEAADLLAKSSPTGSYTSARVAVLARNGQLVGAVKWGKEWIIPRASVEAYARQERHGGRPPG